MIKDRRKKPSKGIIIFSSLIIFLGAINFLFIIISFFQLRLELQLKDDVPTLFTQFPHETINFTAFWLSTIVSLFIMLCWIISGIGMLILKEWARQLLLISVGVYFLNKTIDIFINVSLVKEASKQIPVLPLCIGVIFVLVLSISICYFFTHPSVVRQFKKRNIPFH